MVAGMTTSTDDGLSTELLCPLNLAIPVNCCGILAYFSQTVFNSAAEMAARTKQIVG